MRNQQSVHHERDRGLLTKKDRDYLLGRVDYDDNQQERNRRQNIRDRVGSGVIDFALLDRMERRDREQIFSSLATDEESQSDTEDARLLLQGMVGMVRFLYLVSDEVGLPFESLVERGIREAENGRDGRTVKEVDFEITYSDDELVDLSEKLADESISAEQKAAVRGLLSDAIDILETTDDDDAATTESDS